MSSSSLALVVAVADASARTGLEPTSCQHGACPAAPTGLAGACVVIGARRTACAACCAQPHQGSAGTSPSCQLLVGRAAVGVSARSPRTPARVARSRRPRPPHQPPHPPRSGPPSPHRPPWPAAPSSPSVTSPTPTPTQDRSGDRVAEAARRADAQPVGVRLAFGCRRRRRSPGNRWRARSSCSTPGTT